MCGILGYVASGSQAAPTHASFERALDLLARRGPDDRGIWRDDQAWLGHRRLSIIDLSDAGHQPMVSVDGRYVITFNGEVYNFAELRAGLESRGVTFRSNTDTEVILQLFATEGPRSVERMRGMFALAIWDTLERQLFLVRDRLGIKPLYVWQAPGAIAFASELKSLRALLPTGADLEPQAVFAFLTWGSVPAPLTMMRGAYSMEPGSWTRWRPAVGAEHNRYWQVPTGLVRHRTRAQALEELRPALREAVALRCIADVPVGAFLSGGIDSSAVVSLMRDANQRDLRTFAVTFPDTPLDEGMYADEVARRFETRHVSMPATQELASQALDAFLEVVDQPTCDGLNVYLVSQLARQSGLTVALSGLGGDEIFGGYPTFSRARAAEKWIAPMPRIALRGLAAFASRSAPRFAKLEAYGLPGSTGAQSYFVTRGLFSPRQASELLTGRLREIVDATTAVLPRQAPVEQSFHSTMQFELSHYMHNQLLRDADVFGMAHGLEIRVPLIDHKVVEIVAETDPAAIMVHGNKALLRDALSAPLPRNIVERPKMGFTFPFASWVRTVWKRRIEEKLLSSSSMLLLAPRERIWRAFLEGKLHWSRPWSLYVLLTWLEHNRYET